MNLLLETRILRSSVPVSPARLETLFSGPRWFWEGEGAANKPPKTSPIHRSLRQKKSVDLADRSFLIFQKFLNQMKPMWISFVVQNELNLKL
ncbi:hypothetical protein AVEN_11643-1 [Araneus ventricosus]|uniref:Uncharacterized protein n=1 Tax=Araneus ventricosus TaxID=182803 RepID=A0A4Y2HGC5_ARAVE|nr:hypothetical protein AVEN_11643-1 [Araneus ventricosus]